MNTSTTETTKTDDMLDARDMHREAQARAAQAIESLGDALEELAILGAELAAAELGPLEVSVEDLEGPDAARRRCHAAQVLTLAARIAQGRSLARAAKEGESEAAWVAIHGSGDLETATAKQ